MNRMVLYVCASLLMANCMKTGSPNLEAGDVGMGIPADVMAKVVHDFGRNKDLAIMNIRQEFSLADESHRVLRCLVFLSKGDLDHLSQWITRAKEDYRDILFRAEYVDWNSQKPIRVRNFCNPFGEESTDDTHAQRTGP